MFSLPVMFTRLLPTRMEDSDVVKFSAIFSAILEVLEPSSAARRRYVTASGNNVFDLKASGFANYSYEEGYSDVEVPIYISVSIDPEGKIIACVTTKQSESKGYGDACGTDEYVDKWAGVSDGDVVISTGPIGKDSTDVGAIAGATYTTVGYQKAVKAAFAAFEILTANGGEE